MDNNVLLVFGGNSFEHDISIITALIVLNRAKEGKYRLIPLYLSKNNEWFLFFGEKLNIKCFKNFKDDFSKNNFVKAYFKGQNKIYFKKGLFEKSINISSAINCCHGGVGENGTLSAFFDVLNIPFSSGSVQGQAVGMDKVSSKYFFQELNLPSIKYFKFTKNEFVNNIQCIEKRIKKLNYPLILKPATLGSSIGIGIAKNYQEFLIKAKVALEFDDVILVEKALDSGFREFNVACLKLKNKTIISEIEEVKKSDEILSFKDKYIGDEGISRKGKMPSKGCYVGNKLQKVDLQENQIDKLKEFSYKIYNEFGFCGPVRIDFIMDNKNKIYINEVNTVPGSLAYYLFIPTHFKTMNDFVEAIVEDSIYQKENKTKVKKEFITNLI